MNKYQNNTKILSFKEYVSENQNLKESFRSKDFLVLPKSPWSEKKQIDVIINPKSDSQVAGLLRSSKYKEGRWVADPKSKKIWIWKAEDGLHRQIKDALGLPKWDVGQGHCGLDKKGKPIAMLYESPLNTASVVGIGNKYFNGILRHQDAYDRQLDRSGAK